MVRLVLRLSPLAKAAALVALLGAVLAVYGRLETVGWATLVGTVLLFGGAIVYYVERFRMIRRRRTNAEGR
ncbi:MAG: hypothetical protein ACYTEZ_03435 [Planctomycetota bacterium]